MSASINLHHTTTTAHVNHFPHMHFVSIDATAKDGSNVSLFFSATNDDSNELAQAEAWVLGVLGKLRTISILKALNTYTGDNIWVDLIRQLDGYDNDATNLIDPSYSSDRFIAAGVEYRYDERNSEWTTS